MVKMQSLRNAAHSCSLGNMSGAEFAMMVRSQEPLSDEALAELIELDGRSRIASCLAVELKRYLDAIPDLPRRIVALDAAIDMALRSLSGGSTPSPEVVRSLQSLHPELSNAIREAAILGEALCSTSVLASRLRPQSPLPLPSELGTILADGKPRYLLTQCLGHGSQGQVYLATDRLLSEPDLAAHVAIKVLAPSLESSHSRGRLAEEATKARRINHPNVVRVLDRGATPANDEYIVYEYVPGGDLASFLSSQGRPLPTDRAIHLVAQIARGVHSAHAAGLVHCDLKPANIMMDGLVPKVADFGVAVRLGSHMTAEQMYRHGVGLGNIAFTSPEQFQFQELGATIPSDIYSLGGLLYFLLTGLLPNGSSFNEICANLDAASHTPPPSIRGALPKCDADLERVCKRAMARQPSTRHQSAGELADDLDRLLKHEPIPWTRPTAARRARLAIRRRPRTTVLCGMLGLGVAIALGIGVRLLQDAEQERAAEAVRQRHTDRSKEVINDLFTFLDQRRKLSPLRPKISTVVLSQGLLMQWALGPDVFKFAHQSPAIWRDRLELGRAALGKGSGIQTDSLESLLWESSVAYWLVCEGSPEDALQILTRNRRAWAAKLSPSDPWLLQLQSLEACAQVRRELMHSTSGLPVDMSVVESAEAVLCGERTLFSSDPSYALASQYRGPNEGTGLQILVLQTLMDLYSSPIRRNIALRDQVEQRLMLYLSREKKPSRDLVPPS